MHLERAGRVRGSDKDDKTTSRRTGSQARRATRVVHAADGVKPSCTKADSTVFHELGRESRVVLPMVSGGLAEADRN